MAFDEWKIDPKDRFTGNINTAVKLDGTTVKIGQEKIAGKRVTRHHIIDIRTLQDCWNKACDLEDTAVIEALALWAGTPTQLVAVMKNNTIRPNKVIQQVCWNPFNIVVGPGANIRPANPGEREFDYIAFIENPTVAKLEFNEHIKRSRHIEQYMKLYLAIEDGSQIPERFMRPPSMPAYANARNAAANAATIKSLISFLNSDRPSVYPTLFKALRKGENPQKAEMNKEADKKRPEHASVYSPDYIPGALLDPAFWDGKYVSRAQDVGPVNF